MKSRNIDPYEIQINNICEKLIRDARPKTPPPVPYDDSAERAAEEAARQKELQHAQEQLRLLSTSVDGPRSRSQATYYGVGDDEKIKFLSKYPNITQITERSAFLKNQPDPITAYLARLNEKRLKPEAMGIVKRAGTTYDIDVKHYGMGDTYAEALGEGLGHIKRLGTLDLRNNRLTEQGGLQILQKINANSIHTINLSDNAIGEQCIELLCSYLQDAKSTIKVLNLEGNKLGDRLVGILCETLRYNDTVEDLNLARNNLTEFGVKPLCGYVAHTSSLKKLDLHYNNIRGKGARDFCASLRRNKTLKVLDISFNSFGSPADRGIGKELGKALNTHSKLFHLDISHNKFCAKDVGYIGAGIDTNHHIMGVHIAGNEGKVDNLGFIQPDATLTKSNTSHIFTRILGNQSKVQEAAKWRTVDNCWICEQWSDVEFVWKPEVSGNANKDPLFIHLDLDDYEPDLMTSNPDGTFRLSRMLPPRQIKYFFSQDGIAEHALDQPKTVLPHPYQQTMLFYEDREDTVSIQTVNYINVEACQDLKNIEYVPKSIPRQRRRWKAEKIAKKWTIPISLFRDYRFDNESHLNKCFEHDWDQSRITRIVKIDAQQSLVKKVLKENYKAIRECYKYFAAIGVSGGVWSIGQNAITEFAMQCQMFDGENLKLTDLDVNMSSTLFSEIKNNPRNPADKLIRYQFLELLVRLAIDKYFKTNIKETYQDAVSEFLQKDVLQTMKKYTSEDFRWNLYICEAVDLVLKAYLPILRSIFKQFSGRNAKPGVRPFMSLEEFYDLCNQASLINENFAARDVDLFYNQSMMTQIDEVNKDRHFQMQFVEFIEALARVAWQTKAPTPTKEQEVQEGTLARYLENIMPNLVNLCPADIRNKWRYPKSSPFYVQRTVNTQRSQRAQRDL